jgi:uncharacterized membrane protein YeaQ/YmgE (transglycosylase-associated protein family)
LRQIFFEMQENRMNQPLGVLGTPGVGFFALIVIGALAGWIAEKITSSDHGLFTNILVGIAGSFIGTSIAEMANLPIHGFWMRIIAAVVGSVVLIYGWRMIHPSRSDTLLPPPGQ